MHGCHKRRSIHGYTVVLPSSYQQGKRELVDLSVRIAIENVDSDFWSVFLCERKRILYWHLWLIWVNELKILKNWRYPMTYLGQATALTISWKRFIWEEGSPLVNASLTLHFRGCVIKTATSLLQSCTRRTDCDCRHGFPSFLFSWAFCHDIRL